MRLHSFTNFKFIQMEMVNITEWRWPSPIPYQLVLIKVHIFSWELQHGVLPIYLFFQEFKQQIRKYLTNKLIRWRDQ